MQLNIYECTYREPCLCDVFLCFCMNAHPRPGMQLSQVIIIECSFLVLVSSHPVPAAPDNTGVIVGVVIVLLLCVTGVIVAAVIIGLVLWRRYSINTCTHAYTHVDTYARMHVLSKVHAHTCI